MACGGNQADTARSGSSGIRTTPGELLDGSLEKWLSFRVPSGSVFDVA